MSCRASVTLPTGRPRGRRSLFPGVLLGLTIAGVAALPVRSASAQRGEQRDSSFTWSGSIPAGRSLVLRNVNGGIEVVRSRSGRVEVMAEKRWRRGDPAWVRVEQQRAGDDVIICALWGPDASCDAQGMRGGKEQKSWTDRNDVSVRFVVRIPDGVRVDATSVNGGVTVADVGGAVRARSVNGSITVRTAGGPVDAESVNGSITVAMGSIGTASALRYETVNGSITLTMPSTLGARVDLETVNGRVESGFPILMTGTPDRRRLLGSIGNGTVSLQARSVNGSVTLQPATAVAPAH